MEILQTTEGKYLEAPSGSGSPAQHSQPQARWLERCARPRLPCSRPWPGTRSASPVQAASPRAGAAVRPHGRTFASSVDVALRVKSLLARCQELCGVLSKRCKQQE